MFIDFLYFLPLDYLVVEELVLLGLGDHFDLGVFLEMGVGVLVEVLLGVLGLFFLCCRFLALLLLSFA